MHMDDYIDCNAQAVRCACDSLSSRPSSPQVHVNLYFQIVHETVIVYDDGSEESVSSVIDTPEICTDSLVFDFGLLENNEALSDYLWPRLSRFGLIPQDWQMLVPHMVDHIGSIMATNPLVMQQQQRNRFCFDILLRYHSIHSYQEEDIIREYEEDNCRMVPSAKKSRSLKRVQVGTGSKTAYDEDTKETTTKPAGECQILCTICLEELKDFAAVMPCDHLFHETCIDKWLDVSHYCPVCRYEMPAER